MLHYLLLAQDKIEDIGSQKGEESLVVFLSKRLRDAESHAKKGKQSEAEAIWISIRSLYENNVEADVHVTYAKKRLAGDKNPGPTPDSDAMDTSIP